MSDDKPLDMLQIKIDRAMENLPRETRKAIASVDWRAVILSFREKKGYSFEQLEDLELETELLLCGLLEPKDYPKKLEEELKIPRPQIDLLVQEMNELVFKKIKDELIKNTERESVFIKKEEPLPRLPRTSGEEKGGGLNTSNVVAVDEHIVSPNIIKAGPIQSPAPTPAPTRIPIEKLTEKTIEKPTESILSQKLSGSFQIPTIKTEYSLNNITKEGNKTNTTPASSNNNPKISKTDPYRIDPNE